MLLGVVTPGTPRAYFCAVTHSTQRLRSHSPATFSGTVRLGPAWLYAAGRPSARQRASP